MSWSRPTIQGTPPAPREGHTVTLMGSNLVVFGGLSLMRMHREVSVLDTSAHFPQYCKMNARMIYGLR